MQQQFSFEYDGNRYSIPLINSDQINKNILNNIKKESAESKRWIIVAGQDQLTHKAFYYAKEMEKYEVSTFFISEDRSNLSIENIKEYNLNASIVSNNIFTNWFTYVKSIKKYKPSHIEFFLSPKPWTLIFYTFIAKIFKVPIVSWCRGSEILDWEKHRLIRRFANRFALESSQIVLIRELYMPNYILKYKITDISKVKICHNAVPVPVKIEMEREQSVLFLNSFKPFRNPLLIVEAASIVLKKVPGVKFIMVGTTSHRNNNINIRNLEKEVKIRISQLGLEDNFEILPFTNDTEKYLTRASIFILPADIIFCNNSLIEAMAHGVIPVISDAEGANLIVDNNKSGFIVEREAEKIAEKLIYLLSHQENLPGIRLESHKKIHDCFNSEKVSKVLLQMYYNELWR